MKQQLFDFAVSADPLLFFNMGLGQDSAGMAAGYVLGKLPDWYYQFPRERVFFLFANTGAEWPLTYLWQQQYFAPWCREHGLQFCTLEPGGPYHRCAPSPRYPEGRVMQDIMYEHMKDAQPSFPTRASKRCTTNAKGRPLSNKRAELTVQLRGIDHKRLGDAVAKGRALPNYVAIGYAADEVDRARKSDAGHTDRNWKPVYPLIELGWTRADCRRIIQEAGLPVPIKSGCVCCPWQPDWAFWILSELYPAEFARVEQMENLAIQQRQDRGLKPYYLKGDAPIRETVRRWRDRHPHDTVTERLRMLYEKDVYAVGRECTLESDGVFCNPLALPEAALAIFTPA